MIRFLVQQNRSGHWHDLNVGMEFTLDETKQLLKNYRKECPKYAFRLVEKITTYKIIDD